MMKTYATLITFCFLCLQAIYAQVVNIENRRAGDGTYGFSGALDLTLSAQQQKDLLVTMHFKPLIQYKFSGKQRYEEAKRRNRRMDSTRYQIDSVEVKKDKNKHLLLLITDVKYTGARKNTYANFGMTHLRYAYRIANSGWKWESYAQIQYNKLLLQKVRTVLGTGLRAKIMDIEPKKGADVNRVMKLFVGSSLFYEYEEIQYGFRPMDFNNDIRWSTYLSSYFNFKIFEFASSSYIQPALGDFRDTRISGDYSVLFRVTNPFSIKLNFSHFYDARPPETVMKNTFSMSAGFVYKLDNFKVDPEKIAAMKLKKAQKKEERAKEKLAEPDTFD